MPYRVCLNEQYSNSARVRLEPNETKMLVTKLVTKKERQYTELRHNSGQHRGLAGREGEKEKEKRGCVITGNISVCLQ